ncbi:uncharacterized protein H6S33_000288 [Morchella sextelata]|uniref:uncharacterized protein n=1 Tax=Morchella sextelata TaxID=1174677 RepID=UPI001D03E3B9|nr:uncharacterized protein H6S33_000288 [Morchella sextelata]KAH0614652.1 hypothetical protein H6S33_000288 [Morchella sextelata]
MKTGSLIYLIQRGLQYVECAALVNKDTSLTKGIQPQQDGGLRKKSAEPFCFFPNINSAVDVEDEGVGEENVHAQEDDDDPMEGSNSPTSATTTQTTSSRKHGRDDVINGNGVTGHKRRKKVLPGADGDTPMTDGFPETPVPVELNSIGTQMEEEVVELTAADTILLGQEDKSVLTCAWNPVHSTVLVTASPDSIARIWNVPLEAAQSSMIQNKIISHEPLVQKKATLNDPTVSRHGDVTALRWSPQGDLLATGSFDGQTRIWTTDGFLRFSHSLHKYPVTNLKWNKSANTLLSLSCDGKIIAWDAVTGDLRKSYELANMETAGDMDWVEDNQFVACGDKGGVFKYDLNTEESFAYSGHEGEVNCISWDEVSDRFATGGAVDNTVMIWDKTTEACEAKLTGHIKSVVSLVWQPITTNSPPTCRILASASDDRTIRIWNTISRTLIHELQCHIDPIESISFSPDGSRLASSANGRLVVWKTETGTMTHVYDGTKVRRKNGKVSSGDDEGINQISWDEGGVRVAVGGGELKCSVIRLKPSP